MQDITREPIDIIIKASESAVSQAVDFAMRTDEQNKRLVKLILIQCIVFALVLVFTAGFYFIGYTEYPKESAAYVEKNQGNVSKDILQETKEKRPEGEQIDGR